MILRYGDRGDAVASMQRIVGVTADGAFGTHTLRAVRRFQIANSLTPDGVWGPRSEAAAASDCSPETRSTMPPKPEWAPIIGNAARAQRWGHIAFTHTPTSTDPEAIKITNNFIVDNIVSVSIPQLRAVVGAPASGRVYLHRDVAGPMVDLWKAWDEAGLLPLVRTWAGMWVPRFIRGSRTTLSNHAYGTAFDINAPWNGFGREPAPKGSKGSVVELVPIANSLDWWWGGHYSGRKDGMHLEYVGRS